MSALCRALHIFARAVGSLSDSNAVAPSSSATSRVVTRSPAMPASVPPNSTKRYGDSGKLVPENAFSAAIVVASRSSQRVTGTPDADQRRRRAARGLDRRERGARDDDVIRNRMQPQRQLGDHAERPFRADDEIRQVVAGRRLDRARARADDAAVGEHDLELEHVRAHAAVPHGRRAARIRRRHAAERRVRARVDREPEAVRAGRRVELRARHAGLHGRP